MSNRARRKHTRALRRRLIPDPSMLTLTLRLQGNRQPITRAEFARGMVDRVGLHPSPRGFYVPSRSQRQQVRP